MFETISIELFKIPTLGLSSVRWPKAGDQLSPVLGSLAKETFAGGALGR